ncbi:hypothetical protein IFM46972_07001 [Aspergillus udagawae]|uniref:Uncharacterized protein n=1 Tax=Aspergillus udagawae TaxID=91492 RepID=A0A8H3P749_9EURO|nr:hypothetical protein IFM46972_07001 [Aspergillus udagawae]
MSHSKETYGTDNATLEDSCSADQATMTDSKSLGSVPSNRDSPCRLYHIYNTLFRHDYNVHNANKEQLYHVHNSTWTPKKPDLSVHAGTSAEAPVLAVCKFLHFSRHLVVGLGNPETPNSVDWEDLVSLSHLHARYRFQMSLNSEYGVERRAFIWKSTHSVGIGDTNPSKFSWRNYKLVDEATDRLVAVFTSSIWGCKKSGKLEIYANYGENFDLMVIITALALYEKQRRRDNRSSSGGGGGAGGGGG